MSRMAMKVIVAAFFTAVTAGVCGAGTITQTFNYQWPDVSGNAAATRWQYQQYQAFDKSLGTLNSVAIRLLINVDQPTQGGNFSYRNSFFTGWSPVEYQFYASRTGSLPENGEIAADWLFSSESDLSRWTNPQYGNSGHVYFETKELDGAYTVNATEEIIYDYTEKAVTFSRRSLPPRAEIIPAPVPEPSTFLLFGVALAGAGFLRRKGQNRS